MRYIALSKVEEKTLEEAVKNHHHARQRMRAQGLLLSHRGFKINAIARIYSVDRDTVAHWFDRWERLGIVGLQERVRSGRPEKLTPEEQERVRQLFKTHARAPKQIVAEIVKETGKSLSVDTIRRMGKKYHLRWKRIRRPLKHKREQQAFKQAKEDIKTLRAQSIHGGVDLYFFDVSGFSLTPSVPYAWQPIGEWIEVPSTKSQRLNALGFLSSQGPLHPFVFEGSVDTPVIIACFDALCQTLTRPTWVVLDNASQHTSHAFKARIPEWEKAGLSLYYLPPYCPELNLIEILWRFIKYRWLPFTAYLSYQHLKEALENILANFGKEYHITFA